MLTRRSLTAGLAASVLSKPALAQSFGGGRIKVTHRRPKFGAIRWDAWYSMDNSTNPASPGYQLAVNPGTLAPNTWQFRAPVASTVGSNTIAWVPTQATMDAEIIAASGMSLDFWIFLRYQSTAVGMDNAYNLYATSSLRFQLRFAIMKQTNNLGSTGNFATQNADTLALMQLPNYMFVGATGRPIFYVLYSPTDITNQWGSDIANLKAALDALRSSVQSAGLLNPYIVTLYDGTSSDLITAGTGMGADAVGTYIGHLTGGNPQTYAAMATSVKNYWTTIASFGHIVPTCNFGYDPSPLNQLPPSFWTTNNVSVTEPTPTELAAHLQDGSNYVDANPTICDAFAVTIYAWSECAEGGVAMMPTIGDPTGNKGRNLLLVN